MHEIDLVCDLVILFIAHQQSVSYKWESTELSVYRFKPVCWTSFETLWERLQNSLGIKLTTDGTLLCPSALDNDIFVYFLCHKYGFWN